MTVVTRASPHGAHEALRRGTRDWHRAVEDAFAVFDLGQADGLRRFLRAQARAVLPIEGELDRHDTHLLLRDWPRHRRGAALIDDLASLGATPPVACQPPDLSRPAHRLGAIYVLEGSRLGGRMLARRIDQAGQLPTSFFRHEVGPGAWQSFLAVLDAQAEDPGELLEGAGAAFRLFQEAASLEAASNQEAAPR